MCDEDFAGELCMPHMEFYVLEGILETWSVLPIPYKETVYHYACHVPLQWDTYSWSLPNYLFVDHMELFINGRSPSLNKHGTLLMCAHSPIL